MHTAQLFYCNIINFIMVIHPLELGFILSLRVWVTVAGVGEKFLMNAKLKPLCGGKFVIQT